MTEHNSSLFDIQNLSKTYFVDEKPFNALSNISFAIAESISLAITGKSGSGKSTLINILALMDSKTDGKLLIDGKDIDELSEKEKNQLRIETFGFIFQTFFLNDNLNVFENVMMPLEIAGIKRQERKDLAIKALESVGLSDMQNNMPNELSGGQKQRVCIARAIVNSPKIIFADEPTGNLDSENSKIVEDLLFDIQKTTGTTLLIVTHDESLANRCQEKIEIKDGQIV